MKVIILCGGFGTRLGIEAETRPKPMIEIGGKPILWHIMKYYAHYGHTEFILCLGYKAEIIKQYFYNFHIINDNFTIDTGSGQVEIHRRDDERPWRVTLVDTGLNAMTGARVKRVQELVEDNPFMLTYGDGVTDLNLNELLEYHASHGKIGTVTGVAPPSRYGELMVRGNEVRAFLEKPDLAGSLISGGFFVFKPQFFDYLDDDDGCVLERSPLSDLATDGQLMIHKHRGFWKSMDTPRDQQNLTELWNQNSPPWKLWK